MFRRFKGINEFTGKYRIDLDIFGLYYFLESCFRGSHLRTSYIDMSTDIMYNEMKEEDRFRLYTWIKRDVYNNDFKPISSLCGSDIWWMSRFNPDNQYKITIKDSSNRQRKQTQDFRAFKVPEINPDRFYVGVNEWIPSEEIIRIEKLEIKLRPNIA